MLDYLGEKKSSQAIFDATEKVLSEGKSLTYDMGGSAKASQMVDAIIEKMG